MRGVLEFQAIREVLMAVLSLMGISTHRRTDQVCQIASKCRNNGLKYLGKWSSVTRSVVLLDDLSSTSDETSSSGGNKTDLSSSGGLSVDGRGVTDMLVVTSSVGMLHGVHGNTSHSGPVVSLCSVLVPGVGSLKDGLVSSLTSSGNSDHSSARSEDGLSGSGGESDSGLSSIIRVSNDDGGAS